LNFQFFVGSSIRDCSRAFCSSRSMCRKNFTIVVPESVNSRSKALIWS